MEKRWNGIKEVAYYAAVIGYLGIAAYIATHWEDKKPEQKYYVIQKGDRLGDILRKNYITLDSLCAYNKYDFTDLHEGDTLYLTRR